MNLEVILSSEFPYKENLKSYFDKKPDGCAIYEKGEAWLFIDNLTSNSNLELIMCCWHCKNAVKTDTLNGVAYFCGLKYDKVISVLIAEINRVSIRELVHLCGFTSKSNEKICAIATVKMTEPWFSCVNYTELIYS